MPARRPGGKAASRKARQRYVPRTPAAPKATDAPAPEPASTPEPEIEVAPASTPTAAPQSRSAASSRRRPPPQPVRATGSGLSARERADYHYVERDLRNIAILTVVMAVLLALSWVVFNAAGLLG